MTKVVSTWLSKNLTWLVCGKLNTLLHYRATNSTKNLFLHCFSLQTIICILAGVLEALCALHQVGIIHGAVHPNNIFVDDDGKGILADYDFTKSTVSDVFNSYCNVCNVYFSVYNVIL